jgi:hypothetical protein
MVPEPMPPPGPNPLAAAGIVKANTITSTANKTANFFMFDLL